jgi:hypothetical protein
MKPRLLLFILVPPFLLFVCALILIWIPLPRPFPPALSGARNRMAALLVGLLGVGYLAGLGVYLLTAFGRAGQAMEPLFQAEGWTAQRYALWGRQYRGTVGGREAQARFFPAQGLRSTRLDLYLQAELPSRAAVGAQRPLLDCGDCPRLDGVDLPVYAQDEAWMRRLLADSRAAAALQRLVGTREGTARGEVYLQPDRIWLRARLREVSAEQVQGWLEDLLVLAERGEA